VSELLEIGGWLLLKADGYTGSFVCRFCGAGLGVGHAAQFAALIAPYDLDGWRAGLLPVQKKPICIFIEQTISG
jgi:hypothetical protein